MAVEFKYIGRGINLEFLTNLEETSDEIKRKISNFMDEIYTDISVYEYKKTEEYKQREINTFKSITKAFPTGLAFYSEQFNNPYSRFNVPGLKIYTPKGPFSVHWRKRVIELNWEDSLITKTAKELFPNEDVMKIDRMIHCYGYEKLAEYLKVLHELEMK